MEKLTHDLCYVFGRATKAVSICPPAYYADIVCTRARIYMESNGEQQQQLQAVRPEIKDDMYYI